MHLRFRACLGLLLTACISAPDRPEDWERPELPAAYEEAQAPSELAAIEIDWWTRFEDPVLDSLVLEALAHNHDLGAAAQRVVAAAGQARVAGALDQPSVDYSFSAARNRNVFVGLPIPGGRNVLSNTFTNFSNTFGISWEADLWGRLASQERSALASLAAIEAERAGVQLSVSAQTVDLWFGLIDARLQRELAERTLANFQDSERFVGERYRAGVAAALDLRLAETQTAGAAAALTSARQVERSSRRALEVLLGRYPSAELEAQERLPSLPGPVPAGLPIDLISRRPDLVAAEQSLLALEATGDSLRADLYPRLALTGSFGTTSDMLEDLLDGDFSIWGLAAGLAQPVLDGGRRRAEIEVQDARLREARARFAQSVLMACSEVENALDSEFFLDERAGHLSAALVAASAAEELSEAQYKEGLVDIVTLLEAQRNRITAESSVLSAERAVLSSRVALIRSLGGGLLPGEPQ